MYGYLKLSAQFHGVLSLTDILFITAEERKELLQQYFKIILERLLTSSFAQYKFEVDFYKKELEELCNLFDKDEKNREKQKDDFVQNAIQKISEYCCSNKISQKEIDEIIKNTTEIIDMLIEIHNSQNNLYPNKDNLLIYDDDENVFYKNIPFSPSSSYRELITRKQEINLPEIPKDYITGNQNFDIMLNSISNTLRNAQEGIVLMNELTSKQKESKIMIEIRNDSPHARKTQKNIINLEYASINKLIIDNTKTEKNDLIYTNLALVLHGSTIQEIACDQEELFQISLLSQDIKSLVAQNLFGVQKKDSPKLIMHGIYRSELAVFKKLANMLHMYDKEDKIYGEIMDNELEEDSLREQGIWSRIKFWSKKWIFKYSFGWGINLWNIFWSTLVIIGIFAIIYWSSGILKREVFSGGLCISTNWLKNIFDAFWLSVTSFFGIFLSNYKDGSSQFGSWSDIVITTESIIGLIWITVFVAMLSRKFMRM